MFKLFNFYDNFFHNQNLHIYIYIQDISFSGPIQIYTDIFAEFSK